MPKKNISLKWIIWSLAAIFYLYEFFIRVAPSVMIPELMKAFSVDATSIGVLSGFYFYIYAPMQLPVGILTDRYGARKLLALSSLLLGLGALLFGAADSFATASLGRFLMGFGSSFGFVGMVYIASHWFESKRRNVMIGLANTIGMLGAILGQGPMRIGINKLGWRGTMWILAIFGITLAGLIYLLVRNDPKGVKKQAKSKPQSLKSLRETLSTVCKNKQSWLNATVALFFYVTTATFGGLWSIPFIHEIYGVSIDKAGFITSMIFVGWAVGGPLIGIYSDKIGRKKPILVIGSLLGFFLMMLVIYGGILPINLLFVLFFLVGFVSSAELLNFTYSIDVNPSHAKGLAAAFTNFVVIIGTAVFQPLVGYLLDLNWTGQLDAGIRTYSSGAYKIAMATFPLSFLIAFILALFLKEKFRKA